MSIAIAQEVKKLSTEVAYLRHALEQQSAEIEQLRHAIVELSVDLDEGSPPPPKRGPGRPKKEATQ